MSSSCEAGDCAILVFFFSSRRRHTRSLCDWSSDVCSSDLYDLVVPLELLKRAERTKQIFPTSSEIAAIEPSTIRSEERRVGKECRSRGVPYHYKKKIEEVADSEEIVHRYQT